MPLTKFNVIDFIHRHIRDAGGDYTKWHVGTCNSADHDLPHVARAQRDSLLLKKTPSTEDAATVVAYFIHVYHTNRADNLGPPDERDVVYVYQTP